MRIFRWFSFCRTLNNLMFDGLKQSFWKPEKNKINKTKQKQILLRIHEHPSMSLLIKCPTYHFLNILSIGLLQNSAFEDQNSKTKQSKNILMRIHEHPSMTLLMEFQTYKFQKISSSVLCGNTLCSVSVFYSTYNMSDSVECAFGDRCNCQINRPAVRLRYTICPKKNYNRTFRMDNFQSSEWIKV